MVLARWESQRGAYWVELLKTGTSYGYRGNGCSGTLAASTSSEAMAIMQLRVASGYFLPDSAKLGMKQVV